jgi:hypothetical protein
MQRSGKRQHRVEVELGDGGEVEAEARQPVDEIDKGREVRRRRAAESPDEDTGLPGRDELFGVHVRERGDPERRLADELSEHPAGSERDERAEHGILDEAGEELRSSRDHRLEDDRAPDALDRGSDGVVTRQVEGDPARLGLVRSRDRRLDDDREAQ